MGKILCLTLDDITKKENVTLVKDSRELPTIFDFEVFVVDFSAISTYAGLQFLQEKRGEIIKFLRTGGCLFVLCISNARFIEKEGVIDSTAFLPLTIKASEYSGDTIMDVHPSVKDLFDKFEFSWYITLSGYSEDYTVLARNRAGDTIGVAFPYESGHVVILPCARDPKALDYIIENHRKITSSLRRSVEEKGSVPAPDWVAKFPTPQEQELLEQSKNIEAKLDKYTSFKRLFFESGKGLEKIVKKTFLEFGLTAEKVGEGTVPDLEVDLSPESKGVVEIKGVTGKIDLDDLRQLLQYYVDKREIERQNVKGIFVCNWNTDKPPDERQKEPFSQDALELAEKHDFCLLTTSEFYHALVAIWEGNITKDEIREKIVNAKRICRLVEKKDNTEQNER